MRNQTVNATIGFQVPARCDRAHAAAAQPPAETRSRPAALAA
jgi:hypothetical protein